MALYLPLCPPGRLEANQTLEGAGSSITSVDFDPSVRGLCPSSLGWFPVSTLGSWGLLDLEVHGYPRTGPSNPPP